MSKKGRFSKVTRRMWRDEKVRRLTPLKPSGQALWVWLLTCPYLTNVAGLFDARQPALADELGWSLEDFRSCWAELEREQLVEADWIAGLVWIPNAIMHNEPESIHVVSGWDATLLELPECELKNRALIRLEAYCTEKGESWAEAYRKATGMATGMPSDMAPRKPSKKPPGMATGMPSEMVVGVPSPIQEQEQEQEQEERETRAQPSQGEPTDRAPSPTPIPMPASVKRFKSRFSDSEAPDLLEFTEEHRDYANQHGLNIEQVWLECRDNRRAKGLRRENWCAEFMYWLRNEVKFKRNDDRSVAKTKGAKPPKQPNGGTFGSAFLAAGAKS